MYLQGRMKYHPIFVSVYFLRLHRSVSLTADIFFLLMLLKLKVVLVQSLSKSSTWKKYTAGFMFCFFILITYYLPALCFSSGTFPPQVVLCYLKSKKRRRAQWDTSGGACWVSSVHPYLKGIVCELTFGLSNCGFYAEVRLELRGLPKLLQKLLC